MAAAVVASRRGKERAIEQRRAELEPVQKLAFEDVTALGTDLQDLDGELAGVELDAGARADYQRALDAYEAAKTASDRLDRARRCPARHRDHRGRSLRHRLRARPGGR